MALRHKIREVVFAALDIGDAITGKKGPLTPPRRLMNGGSNSIFRSDFTAIGDQLFDYLVNIGGLKAEDKVLDVGCSVGRMAIPLTRYLTSGTYDGFDIVKASIDYCQQAITPVNPRFQFKHADVRNSTYNRGGVIEPADFRFPYPEGAFTFIFLTSVFTHMQRAELETYIAEIARVLQPGGRVFATFFLLNPESHTAMDAGVSDRAFAFPTDMGRVDIKEDPDAAVAFEEAFIREVHANNGLQIVATRYGSWRGQASDTGYQDTIISVRA